MRDPTIGRRLSQAIRTWATTLPRGYRFGGTVGGFSFIQLHTRPDPRAPEVQLTLRAAIVDGHPVIQVPELEASGENQAEAALASATGTFVVVPIEAPASAREPNAVCDGCGRTGTIGRAVRTGPGGEQIEVHRFCRACWPEQSARYRARWREEDRLRGEDLFRGRSPAQGPGHGASFVSVTWHATLEMVETIVRGMIPQPAPSPEELAKLAADIQRRASELDGEMPFLVERFIRRYGRADERSG